MNNDRKEKFTPGPWEVAEALDGKLWIVGDNRNFIIGTVQGRLDNQGGSNAHLIAAAPEMYEALADANVAIEKLQLLLVDHSTTEEEIFAMDVSEKIYNVLKKARGEV